MHYYIGMLKPQFVFQVFECHQVLLVLSCSDTGNCVFGSDGVEVFILNCWVLKKIDYFLYLIIINWLL